MELSVCMERYLQACQKELKDLIRQLCCIPAPSNHEELRAEFCLRWFHENGCPDAYMDDALNVICPYGVEDSRPVTLFTAHTDTVFPDTEPMPMEETDRELRCPGVCDDTANLAVLMLAARFAVQSGLPAKTGLVFAANSGEEGLGNLRGCRALMERYGRCTREFISLDANEIADVVARAVGSHRYRISVRTEGGHSFTAFGKPSAIHVLAELIHTLCRVELPERPDSKTTYNVGRIKGGTSVNTIADTAEMLYEYRSDSRESLAYMEKQLQETVHRFQRNDVSIAVQSIGHRPCAGEVDPVKQAELLEKADRAIRDTLQCAPNHRFGSTDCNIPLSMGIPSVCLGVCTGSGCHTRDEVLLWDSLKDGSRMFFRFLENYF